MLSNEKPPSLSVLSQSCARVAPVLYVEVYSGLLLFFVFVFASTPFALNKVEASLIDFEVKLKKMEKNRITGKADDRWKKMEGYLHKQSKWVSQLMTMG